MGQLSDLLCRVHIDMAGTTDSWEGPRHTVYCRLISSLKAQKGPYGWQQMMRIEGYSTNSKARRGGQGRGGEELTFFLSVGLLEQSCDSHSDNNSNNEDGRSD